MRAELSYILGAFLDCLLKELTTVYLHTTLEFEMFFLFSRSRMCGKMKCIHKQKMVNCQMKRDWASTSTSFKVAFGNL